METFSERVKNIAIDEAINYKRTYVDYEYLLLSRYFEARYYIIAGTEKNYLHLVGVHTNLDQETFYNKCIDRNLEEKDFDFIDAKGNDIKGTVRRKIKVLSNMNHLMSREELYVQEKFEKNRVVCTLGATDFECTVGFIKSSKRDMAKAFPKTLMRGNELKDARQVEAVLRKNSGGTAFDEIIIGNREILKFFWDDIKEIVSENLV